MNIFEMSEWLWWTKLMKIYFLNVSRRLYWLPNDKFRRYLICKMSQYQTIYFSPSAIFSLRISIYRVLNELKRRLIVFVFCQVKLENAYKSIWFISMMKYNVDKQNIWWSVLISIKELKLKEQWLKQSEVYVLNILI